MAVEFPILARIVSSESREISDEYQAPLRRFDGATRALNAGGMVHVENIRGRITVRTWANPQVRVTGSLGKGVEKMDVSGDVRLQGGLGGDVELVSSSGDVGPDAQALNRLELSTVSGDATLNAALKPAGSIHTDTLSGTLALRLPPTTGAKVHVETFSGDITSPSGRVDREEHGPGKSLETTFGNGQGQIKLDSFSGDVNLRLD